MILTKKTLLLSIAAISFVFISNSCKQCKVGSEDTNSGAIVNDVIIYPKGATMTATYNTQFFDGSNTPADVFQVSFDGGITRVPVNWAAYNVLANPVTVKCETEFKRNVSIDTLNGIVRYTLDATTCKACDQNRYIENYVLVKKFPSNYTVLYIPSVKEI